VNTFSAPEQMRKKKTKGKGEDQPSDVIVVVTAAIPNPAY